MVENKLNITPPRRNLNLDLIRCVAVFCVLSIHFFGKTEGFWGHVFAGKVMYVMTAIREFTTVCAPLFALLTGYLCSKKELSRNYYKRIIPILLTYLIASVFGILFHVLYLQVNISAVEAIFMILNVDGGAIGTSWYINMYIGLFMMIPFLNIMYSGLQSQQQKQGLILVLLILTSAPSLLNCYDWLAEGFLSNPSVSDSYQMIIPNWWTSIWPLTYYFIGAYIREYDIKLSVFWNIILLVTAETIFSLYIFFRSYGTYMLYGIDGWISFDTAILSVLLFVLLLHIDLSKTPRILVYALRKISKLSLGIYLCSYISDSILYPVFLDAVPNDRIQNAMMPIFVLSSFCLATVMSQCIEWIIALPGWVRKKIK